MYIESKSPAVAKFKQLEAEIEFGNCSFDIWVFGTQLNIGFKYISQIFTYFSVFSRGIYCRAHLHIHITNKIRLFWRTLVFSVQNKWHLRPSMRI